MDQIAHAKHDRFDIAQYIKDRYGDEVFKDLRGFEYAQTLGDLDTLTLQLLVRRPADG